jgi:hypothetical protein
MKIRRRIYLEHRRASVRCDRWAEKAMRYRQAGELRKAERAEDQAFRCLTRMKRLADRWHLLDALGRPATIH